MLNPGVLAKSLGVSDQLIQSWHGQLPGDAREIFALPYPGYKVDKQTYTKKNPCYLIETDLEFHHQRRLAEKEKYEEYGIYWTTEGVNRQLSKWFSVAFVTIAPGSMREAMWVNNAAEFVFMVSGDQVEVGVSGALETNKATLTRNGLFYVPLSFASYILNSGKEEATLILMYNDPNPQWTYFSELYANMPKESLAVIHKTDISDFEGFRHTAKTPNPPLTPDEFGCPRPVKPNNQ